MTYYNLSSFNKVAQQINDAVRQRGYLAGYTPAQLIARNLTKMIEEACEATQCVKLDPSGRIEAFLNAVQSLAKRHFDSKEWNDCGPTDIEALKNEAADLFVVLCVLTKQIEAHTGSSFDIAATALDKAKADIRRGVR